MIDRLADLFEKSLPEIEVKPGDFVQVAIDALEDGYGSTKLSRDKARRLATWRELEEAMEKAAMVQGVITGKVKAAIFDAKELQVASIKVVTERGIVYLMGLVTEGESAAAGQVARGVGGVSKVVKVFEIITPAELASMPFPPYSTGATPPPAPRSGPGGEIGRASCRERV